MAITISSGCITGVSGTIISIEVQTFNQLGKFIIVGLADTAIQEAKERVQFAIVNSNYHFTKRGIAINLAPAQMRKEGSQLDLAIAVGVLFATKQIEFTGIHYTVFLGELGLEGAVRAIPGLIAILLHAVSKGFKKAYVPRENEFEAGLIADRLEIFCINSLTEINTATKSSYTPHLRKPTENDHATVNFKDIIGNVHAKRALIIGAAGGHNILLTGPPGTGKSLLAKAFMHVLPRLSEEEFLTIASIQSISGELLHNQITNFSRPFRAPHHTASANAIIGGGTIPRPGAITLAHLGVLFLDEFPEFHRDVLESLREPLEEGQITIARTRGSATFPANFQLVAAMNPCPCGYSNDKEIPCKCSTYAKSRYLKKLSGPILDRIDLFSYVPRLTKNQLWNPTHETSSTDIAMRIEQAYSTQMKRQGAQNARLQITLANACQNLQVDPGAEHILTELQHISARGLVRLLKVSRTIADLDQNETISSTHISEAINFRCNI